MRAACVALVALLAACGDMYEDLGVNKQEDTKGTEIKPKETAEQRAAREKVPTSVTEREGAGSAPGSTPGATQTLPTALTVRVAGTREYPTVRGTIELLPAGQTVQVVANIQGLPPGKHAFHVHELGDCTDPKGQSMGPHLDFSKLQAASTTPPTGTTPTGTTPTGTPDKTAGTTPGTTPSLMLMGNLGDLEVKADQPTTYTAVISGLTPAQLNALVGRAVAIHERANDPTKPDGGSGSAIACGVIGVPRPGAPPEG